jgi:hypothetical protein
VCASEALAGDCAQPTEAGPVRHTIVYHFPMFTRRHLSVLLPIAVAIALSGCGSSETSSTTTVASTPAPAATAPPSTGTPTATQSTPTTGAQTTPAPATSTAKPAPAKTPTHTTTQAPKATTEAAKPPASTTHKPFPLELTRKWLEVWENAGASKTTGECMIVKFEGIPGEQGRALAEMVGTQLAVQDHLKFNAMAHKFAVACHSPIT